jgi:hypothetical protein
MIQPPYFERIRAAAAYRWEQLERDADLAGPWHQLFKQVQSPRHVLSELLQNADDAGATDTSVQIEGGHFIFTHNGEDFTEEHFASLCRFGYSNKRALHTIGFRGIGFKSTFSLGDVVELYTPTLSVAFDRQRFTEPIWNPPSFSKTAHTQIRVRIGDEAREQGVEKNLEEWLKSPLSLLFFRHIRRLTIGDQTVHWMSLGPGPVSETEWTTLEGSTNDPILIARSPAEEFPPEALSEIRLERLLGIEEWVIFPPSKVEIVLGVKGQLYVVLPAGVVTKLPFACNAPFIQDSARLKIKDPEISPTNRWLLQRIGKLASVVMLDWIGETRVSNKERSPAYALIPDVDRDDNSLEGMCATIVEKAFEEAIRGKQILLIDNGRLKPANEAVIVPDELLEVWSGDQLAAFLDGANRPALSRFISKADRTKLIHWNATEEVSKDAVFQVLQSEHLPKPESWSRLLKLWAYLATDVTSYLFRLRKRDLRILPVHAKDVMYSPNEVVRLGEKKLLQSEEDWDFLSTHLLVFNQNWSRFLAEQRRAAEERGDKQLEMDVAGAFAVIQALGLAETSDVSEVIEQVAKEFFASKSVPVTGCVRLAQIAARLGANAGSSFRYVTRDMHLRSADVVRDRDGTLEDMFPKDWCQSHLLHADYGKFSSCSAEEWLRWASSERSGLQGFAPLVEKESTLWYRRRIEAELRGRGFSGIVHYPYKRDCFSLQDWDFEEAVWTNWKKLAENDKGLWCRVVEQILAQPQRFWSDKENVRASQVASTGNVRSIVNEPIPASWILRLQSLPCLPDTRGFNHMPAELLLRTPETEPFLDVEPFVHSRLDREAAHPLLKLLGVRDTPTGPERLLERLRALSKAEKPPIREVEKWYERLDQLVDACSTSDLAGIKKAFREERLILTERSNWASSLGVYLSSDEEDVPDAEVVRASVRDLTLWQKIDVAERPTAELAIQWLKELPSGKALSSNDVRRVRSLLARHPARIWQESGHWLNLAGEWVPTQSIAYALSMQSLVPWSHLHEWVKQKTGDLQRLSAESAGRPPFSELPLLATQIEDRFVRSSADGGRLERRPWLNELGAGLQRISLDDDAEADRVRALASVLANTEWQTARELEIIPYIDGVPAGTPRNTEVVWLGRMLYTADRPLAKLARAVSQELGRLFGRVEIADAIKLCFDRSPEFVAEYLRENFELLPAETGLLGPSPEDQSVTNKGTPSEDVSCETEAGIINEDALHQEDGFIPTESETYENQVEPTVDDGAGSEVIAGGHEIPVREPHPPKLRKPTIMERFARSRGFRKDSDNRFFHSDGSWIGKSEDTRYWEHWTGKGELIRYYWAKDHCLEEEPLQLEADIWGALDKFPERYALVLRNLQDEPVEVLGARLGAMRDVGEIVLHPATYRLVYDHDKK